MKSSYFRLIGGSISTGLVSSFVGLKTYDDYKNKVHIEYQEKPSNLISHRCQQILKFGIPKRSPDISCYENHCLCYNQALKTPLWVAEHLNKDNQNGFAARENSNFKSDLNMGIFSSHNKDYKNSGWSRGHMCPVGNSKINQKAMNDSFYLSNIVPQNYENNAGFWNRLEIFCKNLTKRYDDVYVYSGPLYIPYHDVENKKKYVKYEVIGENNVAVPTHLFKVIVAERNNQIDVAAFVVPNKDISHENKLTDFQVKVVDIEKKIGVTMLPRMDYANTGDLCQNDGCKLISKYDFDLYIYNRRLSRARNLAELDNLLQKMQKKGLHPDSYTENVINSKREEFKSKVKI